MPSLKLHLGARTLVARCDPALDLAAESVLRLVEEIEASGNPIRDGARIPLGWSRLLVRVRGDLGEHHLELCEPRFDGDPMAEVRSDITQTLAVILDQASFVQHLGVASQPTPFDHEVVVACGALSQPRIHCERRPDGWYIGPSDLDGDVECTTLRVYELLHHRPAILRALSLPVGYLVAFDGDAVEAVLDTTNCDLWEPN